MDTEGETITINLKSEQEESTLLRLQHKTGLMLFLIWVISSRFTRLPCMESKIKKMAEVGEVVVLEMNECT